MANPYKEITTQTVQPQYVDENSDKTQKLIDMGQLSWNRPISSQR
jgi:hypothetical protein